MMLILLTVLLTILLGLPFATAYNTLRFINYCPYDVYFWIVAPPPSVFQGQDATCIKVPSHGTVMHNMIHDDNGGIALKVRDVPYYEQQPAGILQVEYNLEPAKNSLWYDLSYIDCEFETGPEMPTHCPLYREGVVLYVPGYEEGCPVASCSPEGCVTAYRNSEGTGEDPTWHCRHGVDALLEMCTEGSS